jgi:hypothetical protein
MAAEFLLVALNLYVRIKISIETFCANYSGTDVTQSIAASFQKLIDSAVKSTQLTIDSRCVRRNDQVIGQFEVSL